MNIKNSVTLATGRWSQQRPYNSQYPSNYYMGCVPIAVGEIMCYHKHPSSGEGVLVAQGEKPQVILSDQEYDWDLIPQVLLSSDSEDKIDMTSTFVMHVSRACKIEPKPGTVASNEYNAKSALIDNFKYDKNIIRVNIDDNDELCYTYKEINEMAIEEINLGRPFYVSIPVHAIICNGYDINNKKFLCNWGWGQDDRWTTLDKNGCNPNNLLIGIRPSEEEGIVLKKYTSDFDGHYYNDKGLISFSVENKSGLPECTFRVVLYDAAGVKRNVISEEVNHIFCDGDDNISIPVVLPENLTFGQRNVSVEYKLKQAFRPLRNSLDEINHHPIETKKTLSSISIENNFILPESFRKDDIFNIKINISDTFDESGYIAVALADKKLNNLYTLGFSHFEQQDSSLQIICNLSEPFEERSYELIFLYSEDTDFSDAKSSLVKLSDGIESIDIYVKNKSLDYLDNIHLTSITGIDLSLPIKDYTPYQFNITTKVTHVAEISGPLALVLTNGNDDIIQTYPQSGSLGSRVGEYDFSVGFGSQRPLIESLPMDFKIKFCIWDIANNKYYLLSPSNSDVENPVNTILVHINSYTLIYLDSELKSEHSKVDVNTSFNVEGTLVFLPGESKIPGKFVDIVVYAESTDGVVCEIGRKALVAILPDNPADVSIACKFPHGSAHGKYKVYLQAINDLIAPEDTPTDFISSFDNSDYFCHVELGI